MVLSIDPRPLHQHADTAERARPRSLELAKARMGFRPRGEPTPGWRWPSTWSRRERDEIAADWRPV